MTRTRSLMAPDMEADVRAHIVQLPAHCRPGLLAYLTEGRLPGSFLRCLLENDLRGAVNRADAENIQAIPAYVRFLDTCAPAPAWGSPEAVKQWSARGTAGWYQRGDTERRHHVSREPINDERIDIGPSHRLHIMQDDITQDATAEGAGEWVVWLNTEVSDFDGLVIGIGPTRDEAVTHAVATVEAIEDALQGPGAQ